MTDPIQVLATLSQNMTVVKTKSSLPKQPGLYAFGLVGNPFSNSQFSSLGESSFLYLGKSQKNLHDRVMGKHLNSKRTGSSTLRRTLGALLLEELALTPLPRSTTEKTQRRFESYKFADEGEERLTYWMKKNLQVTFWVAPPQYLFLKDLEAAVIKLSRPGLNLEATNPIRAELNLRRKHCCELAKAHYS
ncbi:MAG: hypothetical protein KIS88_08170 [Anaerolineales bacterium]|nr:hypothetical protein [Anaerolineales bacterium]